MWCWEMGARTGDVARWEVMCKEIEVLIMMWLGDEIAMMPQDQADEWLQDGKT